MDELIIDQHLQILELMDTLANVTMENDARILNNQGIVGDMIWNFSNMLFINFLSLMLVCFSLTIVLNRLEKLKQEIEDTVTVHDDYVLKV